MAIAQTKETIVRKPLRLWPGVAAVVVMWLAWFGAPLLPGMIGGYVMAFGVLLGGVAVVVWWAFFSRAPWPERLGGVLLIFAALFATPRILHESIATGMQGFMFFVYAIPALCLAFVIWAVASRRFAAGPRRATMVGAILLVCGGFALLRTGGVSGDGDPEFHWRWSPTPEERLLAEAGNQPLPAAPAPAAHTPAPAAAETPAAPEAEPAAEAAEEPAAQPVPAATGADWPGFRGPERDGSVSGVRIATDWAASPPVELWRRPVGPAWSSFAVHGDLFYTQEQRGDDEIVACYHASTGEPVWVHRDAARFWESNAGAGPRATPTLSNGRVYTLGATGIVNVLDASSGAAVWSRNAAADTKTEVPYWGFSGSPLVLDDLVVIAAAGALVAYDLGTGEPRWLGPPRSGGYSSPHRATIEGVAQIVLLNGRGVISVSPTDGALLWEHEWSGDGIVQPALTADGGVLLGSGSGMGEVGVRRLAVAHRPGGWSVEERWTSIGLKPYFSDLVLHRGHAFGFDGKYLAAIDLADGKRKWKGGNYGHGQLVLLPDQDLLLVLSEKGELALVKAAPDQFTELARWPAIQGKTWNHPVLIGDLLLARNSEEMVAFRLALAGK